jgi:hypothetical protein
LCRKKNTGKVATLRARSVVGGRRGGPAKHRVRENDRPTRFNSEGLTVTDIIIIIIYFGEFSQPGEKKKQGYFWEKWPKSPHYDEKKKLRSPYFIGQLPTSRQIIGQVFSIL